MRKETMLGWLMVIVMLCAVGALMYYIGAHSGLRYASYPFPFLS